MAERNSGDYFFRESNGGIIMSKLFKRITSAAVAAATVVTMTVAASADTETTTKQPFASGKAEGFLSANSSSNNCYGETRYFGNYDGVELPAWISVAVDVVDTYSGSLYAAIGPKTVYNSSYVYDNKVMWDGITVTLFGSFSMKCEGDTWGDYLELYSVSL